MDTLSRGHFGTKRPEAAGSVPTPEYAAIVGAPRKAAWLCGERRSSGASEFCRLRRNERYAACDDEAGTFSGRTATESKMEGTHER